MTLFRECDTMYEKLLLWNFSSAKQFYERVPHYETDELNDPETSW